MSSVSPEQSSRGRLYDSPEIGTYSPLTWSKDDAHGWCEQSLCLFDVKYRPGDSRVQTIQ